MLATKKVLFENNTNFRIPPIKSDNSESAGLIKESSPSIINNNSLPRIDDRRRNKTRFFEETEGVIEGERDEEESEDSALTEGLFLGEITNQSNVVRINSDDEMPNYREEKLEESSKIMVKDMSSGQIYLLEFKAVDVELIPLYLKHRTFEENQNDKCSQPKSTIRFDNIYNTKSRRFMQLHKSYKIDTSKNEGKLSIMSFKKALFPKRKTFPPDPKPRRKISDSVSNIKQSIIHMKYKNMEFKVKPGLMPLKSSETIDAEANQEREKLLINLNMIVPKIETNKAEIICNYKGDILKFKFTLSEISWNKIKITTSVGVLAKDDDVYVKEYSNISFRTIYIAVPKSNYEYEEPMIKLKQKNRTMKLNNMDPIWLEKQRKNRLKEYNRCRIKNPYDDIVELKNGSSISYETYNNLYNLKGGTFKCKASEEYEKYIEYLQRSDVSMNPESYQEKVDSVFITEIPDWDLILNSK